MAGIGLQRGQEFEVLRKKMRPAGKGGGPHQRYGEQRFNIQACYD